LGELASRVFSSVYRRGQRSRSDLNSVYGLQRVVSSYT